MKFFITVVLLFFFFVGFTYLSLAFLFKYGEIKYEEGKKSCKYMEQVDL